MDAVEEFNQLLARLEKADLLFMTMARPPRPRAAQPLLDCAGGERARALPAHPDTPCVIARLPASPLRSLTNAP